MTDARGDYFNGQFHPPEGEPLRSHNPADNGAVVLETAVQASRISAACDSAQSAAPAWASLSLDERFEVLTSFRAALEARRESIADAIVQEIGKLRSEARGEVGALISRFASVKSQAEQDLKAGPLAGHPTEWAQYHPHGVVGVIGPFNYPLHLVHAHVIPALLMGNSVVIKPSELAPLAAQRYAEAAAEAGFPAGVFNLVQGKGAAGQALAEHEAVRGLCFTGSWNVGHKLQKVALNRPELILALEMGGKNTAVVLPDADLRQAAHEIAVGGYLTTGQRCTCTDRVLVHRKVANELVARLANVVSAIQFGHPDKRSSFAGPLASEAALNRYEDTLRLAEQRGCEVVIPHERQDGGFYARPSLYLMPEGRQEIEGYSDTEVFGPNVAIDTFESMDDVISQLQSSPFGLANAVFTRSDADFDRIYREVHAGVWNLNRTTNKASPRLPFGGVGKSGNARPAGAHAPRNVVYPVAMQRKVTGGVEPHPHLLLALDREDLDQLEEVHSGEEAREAERSVFELQRPMAWSRPKDGVLPKSRHWLERFYAGERFAREKKPGVYDHLRSVGAWIVSVDDEPLAALDGMSQTATKCGGFFEDEVVRAWHRGEFAESALFSTDTSIEEHPAAKAFADALRNELCGLDHVSFTNAGAEANEKALSLCLMNAEPGRKKILAFEGSFHGRTMLSLHSTWNPAKREPFQLHGYESSFAPFPQWTRPNDPEPEAPEAWEELVAAGDLDGLQARYGDTDDQLLRRELDSLQAVHDVLSDGEHFATIVEPMQSEGGDNYATARYHRSLRLLTRHHNVALVYDEVQTGFGLGGSFAWHRAFKLVDKDGNPDLPEAVTFAKRAQVGVCVSVYEDLEPTNAHPASLVRGRIHLEMIRDGKEACRAQGLTWPRLQQIAQAYPHLVTNVRCRGFAFAFDLPDTTLRNNFVAQRWYRGAVVYAAGSVTIRYRLSTGFRRREVDLLFESIRRSLSWLDAHPGQSPPSWDNLGEAWAPRMLDTDQIRIREATRGETDEMVQAICDLEAQVYEPARQDPPEWHQLAFDDPDGLTVVAEARQDGEWTLIGKALAIPLENVPGDVDGPRQDPNHGRENTVYSSAITVHPAYQTQGLGTALKLAQVEAARSMTRDDGSPRYLYLTGRTRVGAADPMMRLNRRLGAHIVDVFDNQYGEDGAQARYYRIPFGPLLPITLPPTHQDPLDARDVTSPLAKAPASLVVQLQRGQLTGPTVTKITICNFITPAIARAMEWVAALVPEMPHVYLTSGRDEGVDKCIRLLRNARPEANVAISFEGTYVGHTSAAARSLSDASVHRAGDPYFDWPVVPHPADVGVEACLQAIRDTVAKQGGAEHVLGLFLEVVGERTGKVVPPDFWPELRELKRELDLPVVMEETASAFYRSGLGPFAMSGLPFVPDLLIWWSGGQNGFVHVSQELFITKPLAMVSTWDGDELSLIRLHHQLRALRKIDTTTATQKLAELVQSADEAGIQVHGLGLFCVFHPEDPDAFQQKLDAEGLKLRRLPNGAFAFAPGIDAAEEAVDALVRALGLD